MTDDRTYVEPTNVTDPEDCLFYHAMDLPGYGSVAGSSGWDLCGRLSEYLGNVDFKGKRVLDVGTASGGLSFFAEQQGAEVVAYDLPEDRAFDYVPDARYKDEADPATMREYRRQLMSDRGSLSSDPDSAL